MERLPKFPEEKFLAESLKLAKSAFSYEKLLIGKQIRALRLRRGWGQKQLAKKLFTSQSAIARIEAGGQNLSVQTLVSLAFIFQKRINVKFQ